MLNKEETSLVLEYYAVDNMVKQMENWEEPELLKLMKERKDELWEEIKNSKVYYYSTNNMFISVIHDKILQKIDQLFDAELTFFFNNHIKEIESWFNILTPQYNSLDKLKEQLNTLRNI